MSVFYSCAFDTGLVDVPRPLGSFTGVIHGDSIPQTANLRLAVIWQSTNGGISTWDLGNPSLDAGGTSFTGSITRLPETEISNSDEFILGKLCLYNDTNGNHKLDFASQEYERIRAEIHDVKLQLQTSFATLMSYGDTIQSKSGVSDSFWVGNGRIYHGSSTNSPVIKNQEGAGGREWDWRSLLKARFRVLFHPDKWEDFFNHDGSFSTDDLDITGLGVDTAVTSCQLERLRPHKGREAEFEQTLQATTLKQAILDSLTNAAKSEINRVWHQEAPNLGFERVLASSDSDYIVYFSGQNSRNAMLEAEKASAFSVAQKGNLRVGFNLMECDTVGACVAKDLRLDPRTLKSIDPVSLSSGVLSIPVFEFPTISSNLFYPDSITPTDVSPALDQFIGEYQCSCGKSLEIVLSERDGLSLMTQNFGTRNLIQAKADSSVFFYKDSTLNLQVRFIQNESGEQTGGYKLLMSFLDRRTTSYSSSRLFAYYVGASSQDSVDSR